MGVENWYPRRDSNPCLRLERAVSWTGLDDGDMAGTRGRPRRRRDVSTAAARFWFSSDSRRRVAASRRLLVGTVPERAERARAEPEPITLAFLPFSYGSSRSSGATLHERRFR